MIIDFNVEKDGRQYFCNWSLFNVLIIKKDLLRFKGKKVNQRENLLLLVNGVYSYVGVLDGRVASVFGIFSHH